MFNNIPTSSKYPKSSKMYFILAFIQICQVTSQSQGNGSTPRFLEVRTGASPWHIRTQLINISSSTQEQCAIMCHKEPECDMFRHVNSTCIIPKKESPTMAMHFVPNSRPQSSTLDLFVSQEYSSSPCEYWNFSVQANFASWLYMPLLHIHNLCKI